MSGTTSDLASRAQAREELALLLSRFSRIGHCGQCLVIEPNEIAGILLDPNRFDRLNALLGYVKADGEAFEYGVRRAPVYGATVAEMPSRGTAEEMDWPGSTVVRRRVTRGPWEVVTDA